MKIKFYAQKINYRGLKDIKCIGHEMYRNVSDFFFERPCRKSIMAKYTTFNRENAGVTPLNTCEVRCNRRIYMEVIVRTDRQTNRNHKHFSSFG